MTNHTPHGQVPEALRLADELEIPIEGYPEATELERNAAAELRRLHAYCQELESQVIRDCMTHVQKPADTNTASGAADSDDALMARELYESQDDSLLLCASDLQHSAIYDNHAEMQSCMRAVAERITALASAPAQPTRDLEAVIKAAADKLNAAVCCHPNAVDTLIHEALEILDGDSEPAAAPAQPVAEPAGAIPKAAQIEAIWGAMDCPAPATQQAGEDVDLPDAEDVAHSAVQEALSFGLSHDVIHRWMRHIQDQTVKAMRTATPQPSPTPEADGAHVAAPADTVVLDAALRAIHQAIDLIGEPDTERLRTVRRVLRGAVVVAEDGTAPQADSQPAPVLDYPPLPECDATTVGLGAVWNRHSMRAYVDADRAARAPAPSVLEDAARLDFLIEQRAYVVSDPDACPGYWLHFVHKETGKCWVQGDEHPTPRAAIDAARKQGGA